MKRSLLALSLLAGIYFSLGCGTAFAQQGLEIKGGYVSTDAGTGWVVGAGLVASRTRTSETVFAVERFQTSSVENIFGVDRESRVSSWPITLTNKVLYPSSRFYYGTGIGVYPTTLDVYDDDILAGTASQTNIGYHLMAGLQLGGGSRLEAKYFQGGVAENTGYSLTFNKSF